MTIWYRWLKYQNSPWNVWPEERLTIDEFRDVMSRHAGKIRPNGRGWAYEVTDDRKRVINDNTR